MWLRLNEDENDILHYNVSYIWEHDIWSDNEFK